MSNKVLLEHHPRALEYVFIERKRHSPEVQNVRRHQPEDDIRDGHTESLTRWRCASPGWFKEAR